MIKKRTATVFDIISKRKISIQVPHTEIVRWLVSRSQLDEIYVFILEIDRQKYSQKKNHVDVWKTCRTLIGKTKKIDAERKAHHRIKIQARCFSCKTSQQDASCLSSLSVSSASFSSSSNPSLVTSSSSSFAFFASVHLL